MVRCSVALSPTPRARTGRANGTESCGEVERQSGAERAARFSPLGALSRRAGGKARRPTNPRETGEGLDDRAVQNGRRAFSRSGALSRRAGGKARRPTDPRETGEGLDDRAVRTGGALFPARGRLPVEREEKRAARLIPARRRPQATHGTYRGGVVGRAGVSFARDPSEAVGCCGGLMAVCGLNETPTAA